MSFIRAIQLYHLRIYILARIRLLEIDYISLLLLLFIITIIAIAIIIDID